VNADVMLIVCAVVEAVHEGVSSKLKLNDFGAVAL
jgi:hypothetical protein